MNNPPITLMSFGFKYGPPSEANMLFDVRFLPNPYWVPELEPLTGLDPAIQEYFQHQALVQGWIADLEHYLITWLPHFHGNAQPEIVIAIGCTGGQHRSVYVVERLAALLHEQFNEIYIEHRDSSHWTQGRLL